MKRKRITEKMLKIKPFWIQVFIAIIVLALAASSAIAASQTSKTQNAQPKLAITKKIIENKIMQNETFTVEVTFHNAGAVPALNIYLKDSLPESVLIDSGNNSWRGQLKPGEGDGFEYKAIAIKKGYLNLGAVRAAYKDSKNVSYSASSNPSEVYIEGALPPTFLDFFDKYQKPLQIIGTVLGAIASVYGIYQILIKKIKKPKIQEAAYYKIQALTSYR